jgi:hypothetical protein
MRRPRPRFPVFIGPSPTDREMARFYCQDLDTLTADQAFEESVLIWQRLAVLFEQRSHGGRFVEFGTQTIVYERQWLLERLRRLQSRHPRVA